MIIVLFYDNCRAVALALPEPLLTYNIVVTYYVVTGIDQYLTTYFKYKPTDLSGVTSAMAHALLARRPRDRYVVGLDARWAATPMIWLPEWLVDSLLMDAIFRLPIPAFCRG